MIYIIKVDEKIKVVAKDQLHKTIAIQELKKKHKNAKITYEKI